MWKSVYIVFMLIFMLGCADIRTSVVKKEVNRFQGIQLLRAMGEAHHIGSWDTISTYRVYFQDHFFGKVGAFGNPFPDEVTAMQLDYIPGTFDGRIAFLSGTWRERQWGIMSWQTYEKDSALDSVIFKKNKDARFWIPTYQYFLEFPARIQEATAVGYAGQKQIGDFSCEGIMVSWGTLAPQRKTDQYLIWTDKTSHRIIKIVYTIREMNTFLKGAVYFNDYEIWNGLLLPMRMPVESNLVRDGMLHEMRIDSILFDVIPPADLRPEMTEIE